jgi:hypothetical protein
MSDERAPDGVIDLTEARPDGEVLRLDAGSPFERLSEKQRVRLIVRVLCELVAYDELDGLDDVAVDETLSA